MTVGLLAALALVGMAATGVLGYVAGLHRERTRAAREDAAAMAAGPQYRRGQA